MTAADVWLLTGNRSGEIAQQRAVGTALGCVVREVPVAEMAPVGKDVRFDFRLLAPPWPRVAISFGKTLAAGLRIRALGGHDVRLVHLGLPRRTPVEALDLVVPMPTDQYVEAPNVLRVRMPFNPAPSVDDIDARVTGMLAAMRLPRPWTALLVGGHTTRTRLEVLNVRKLMRAADEHLAATGGSLFVTTSPRTPPAIVEFLRDAMPDRGFLYRYGRDDRLNPFRALLRDADELAVTGDSASMIAECWRTGKPLWVWPVELSFFRKLKRALRACAPPRWIASGRIAGDVDIDRWIRDLAMEGEVGIFGQRGPTRVYRPERDDDLSRTVRRIHDLLARDPAT